ncbi:hypothetical protein TTHERM_000227538 (macronuclear) [Tetrahymena thermophila SB210]|uniref:Uncharacterized protein n=1 Tax=Tetrahymena thermophila (strain SB210) TaxID=312017 RepID=W7XK99_TETTS|nr:hypothetical protein TTHERM_000227538 [Tetrahymena thermophila SB210]EWS74744.1 hypothetical protein TTHERM_000227538 [Tetrahymena thermophila SB210]|eukprot:XP_012652745.1 hypothetical protein TTHERM_000227538 [Tetrahymena thermophila SB210]
MSKQMILFKYLQIVIHNQFFLLQFCQNLKIHTIFFLKLRKQLISLTKINITQENIQLKVAMVLFLMEKYIKIIKYKKQYSKYNSQIQMIKIQMKVKKNILQ